MAQEPGQELDMVADAAERVEGETAEPQYYAVERNLTQEAKNGELDPVINRHKEIRRLASVLSRRTKNNPVLIGEPGVGKTAIVEGFTQQMARGDHGEDFQNRQVVTLDLDSEDLKETIKEIANSDGQFVTFVDELHTIMEAEDGSGVSVHNMIKPLLARGKLRMVAATTLDEYRKHIEKDPALERRFQPIYVEEPSVEDTAFILHGTRKQYEQYHGIEITDGAIEAASRMAKRYISGRLLPDSAIDLIDEAASRLKNEFHGMPTELATVKNRIERLRDEISVTANSESAKSEMDRSAKQKELDELTPRETALEQQWQYEKHLFEQIRIATEERAAMQAAAAEAERKSKWGIASEIRSEIDTQSAIISQATHALYDIGEDDRLMRLEITEKDISEVVAEWTGIPVTRLRQSELERVLHLEDELRERVVGQDQALEAIASAIRRSRAGLSPEGRPIGSFLFLGPTGVGKTETAKALAEQLFDDEKAMIRIDMSEYGEGHAVSRLVGAPPGYKGYDDGNQLAEPVRRRPFSVVLIDEIEKADSDVHNILLQILEDGRLTDGQGRTVDFTNTVIIMTSNAEVGEGDLRLALREHFPPEFVNRLDETVRFNELSKKDMKDVARIQANQLGQRLLVGAGITLKVSDEAVDYLAEKGYDPDFGARPLKRLIQKTVEDELAMYLLKQNDEGIRSVKISAAEDGLQFETS